MDADFYDGAGLDKAALRQLMSRSDQPALVHLVGMGVLLAISAWGVVWSWGGVWYMQVCSQLFFAAMYCSTFACLHETAHGTAFRSKRMNGLVAVLMGFIQVYPSSLFKELHFTHHRYTHIPGKDPEISFGSEPGPSVIGQLPLYLSWLSGLPLLLFKVGMLVMGALGMPEWARMRLYPFVRPKVRAQVALESWAVLAGYVGLVWLAWSVYTGLFGIFVGILVGHCLLIMYLTPEHNGLPHEGDILHKTRSLHVSGVVRWIMWNMPYHAEHHAYPAVPFHALPQLHHLMKDKLVHTTDGPAEFHYTALRKLLK